MQTSCDTVMVSISMITYNHASFIAEAIESVLMQLTTFPIKLVISDDCSTDSTYEIIEEYVARYPHLICSTRHAVNRGPNYNFCHTIQLCGGKYIAILDGDDYWVDPYKLQKQVSFLESWPDFNICCHCLFVDDGCDSSNGRIIPMGCKQSTTSEDLVKENYIPTSSSVIRRAAVRPFPPWIESMKAYDYAFMALCAEGAKIMCLREVMGAYRIHSDNAWLTMDWDQREQETIRTLTAINDHFNGKYSKIIYASCVKKHAMLTNFYLETGDLVKALDHVSKQKLLMAQLLALS